MKTFVFTDIVRSVDLKGHMPGRTDAERDAAFIQQVLTPHRQHIERGLEQAGGRVVSTAGDGHFLVFDNPIEAAGWAVEVQRRHAREPITSPRDARVEVRMSLHLGFPQVDPADANNFVGRVVDYAARLVDQASGGQLLLSAAAIGLLRDAGMDGVGFHAHGLRELPGIGAVEVYELLYDDHGPRSLRGATVRAGSSEAATEPLPDRPTDGTTDGPASRRPAEEKPRAWDVLPPTMGITEFSRRQSSGLGDGGGGGADGGSSGAAVAKPTPARKIGNYELGEMIGAGGMGNVYKAHHAQFERTRAVKIIKPQFVEDGHEEVIRRFYREIKAIGGLDHPNIVVAIDSSSPDDETHYLVMEYVDGVSAERLIRGGATLSVANACEIARQAAVGLEYIHRQGMVHRDIKPSNLMLTDAEASTLPATGSTQLMRRPVVKILDLGLALLVTEDQPRLTRFDHGAMGTAMYMSPEQWVTTSVDIRADIYSLGCTLYHLLSGKPPYHDSDLKPQRAHERAPTPSAAQDAGAPPELDAVLARMLAKQPDERFPRPAEVAEALIPFCGGADLLRLIDQSRRGADYVPRDDELSETVPVGRPVSDTFGPLPPFRSPLPPLTAASGSGAPSSPAPPRPFWRQAIAPAVVLAAVLFAMWMAGLARESWRNARQANENKLATAARLSADALAKEIDARFKLLAKLSRDRELQAAMQPVASMAEPAPTPTPAPGKQRQPTLAEREAWSGLQRWIGRQKTEADTDFGSNSWFVTDRYGRQVARQPPSAKSFGGWFAHRDYFHGRGGDLPDGGGLPPVDRRHQSAVYRSSSKKELKVAFSVPIVSDETSETIGVLAMSVRLGDFSVLEDEARLSRSLEIALVDLREPLPESTSKNRRGMLLHHRDLGWLENPDDPYVVPAPLLDRVDAALADDRRDGSPRHPILRGYADLLERQGRGTFVGAFEPVVIRNRRDQDPTDWLVVVQEEE